MGDQAHCTIEEYVRWTSSGGLVSSTILLLAGNDEHIRTMAFDALAKVQCDMLRGAFVSAILVGELHCHF